MPITRRQFDLGIDEAVEQGMLEIHRFLASRRTEAYSRDELLASLKQTNVRLFDRALNKLVEIRAVDLRQLRGELYYAYLEDLDKVW